EFVEVALRWCDTPHGIVFLAVDDRRAIRAHRRRACRTVEGCSCRTRHLSEQRPWEDQGNQNRTNHGRLQWGSACWTTPTSNRLGWDSPQKQRPAAISRPAESASSWKTLCFPAQSRPTEMAVIRRLAID